VADEVASLFADLLGRATNPKSSKKKIRATLLSSVDPDLLHHAGLKKLRQRNRVAQHAH